MGLKDDILATDDSAVEPVTVPEWPGELYVRVMTGGERDRYELLESNGQAKMVRATLVAYTLCDAEGKRIFADGDVAAVSEKSSVALDRIFAKAARLNRMRQCDIDELMGNSNDGQSAAPGSL